MPAPLAIDGGTPVRTAPLPPWPAPGADEIAAVTRVLETGRLNYWTGTCGNELEAAYAAELGRGHAIALANGTLALELALRAFEIGPGDEVIVPARTYIATASAVVAVGATPVIADVDPYSGTLTAETVAAVTGPATRAVIPVHLGGWPVDMDPLIDFAHGRGILVIEDCAQAHRGTYLGRPVGALGSDAAAFSFCQDKIVPAGEGGMLVLDDTAAFERAWAYKDHGKSLAKVLAPDTTHQGPMFRWLHDSFGSNWRMPELCAALALAGFRKLPAWHAARTANALRLADGLAEHPALHIPLPDASAGTAHAFYRLYAYVKPELLAQGWDRDRITRAISAEGTPCQYGSCAEIYREEAFASAGLGPASRLPGALHTDETAIAFFVHPTLTAHEIDDTLTAVAKVMAVANL